MMKKLQKLLYIDTELVTNSKVRSYYIGIHNIANTGTKKIELDNCIQARLSEVNKYISKFEMQIYFAGVVITYKKEMLIHLFIRSQDKYTFLSNINYINLIALGAEMQNSFGVTKFYKGQFYRLEGKFLKDRWKERSFLKPVKVLIDQIIRPEFKDPEFKTLSLVLQYIQDQYRIVFDTVFISKVKKENKKDYVGIPLNKKKYPLYVMTFCTKNLVKGSDILDITKILQSKPFFTLFSQLMSLNRKVGKRGPKKICLKLKITSLLVTTPITKKKDWTN